MTKIPLDDVRTRRLPDTELSERELLSQRAFDEVFGPFERDEFRELSDQAWQALLDGQRQTLYDPESWALPPRR